MKAATSGGVLHSVTSAGAAPSSRAASSRPSCTATAKLSSPNRKASRPSKAPARPGSNIVRNDSSSDAAESGSVGSWVGERAAHRPRTWKIGSLS